LTKASLYVYFGPVAVSVCRRFDLSPFWPYPDSPATGQLINVRWRVDPVTSWLYSESPTNQLAVCLRIGQLPDW